MTAIASREMTLIASPGQSRRKQIERCQEFLQLGARIAFMVGSRTRTIVDGRPGQAERRLRGDVLDLRDVIPGLTLLVAVTTICRLSPANLCPTR
jgi:hypothetical protein